MLRLERLRNHMRQTKLAKASLWKVKYKVEYAAAPCGKIVLSRYSPRPHACHSSREQSRAAELRRTIL